MPKISGDVTYRTEPTSILTPAALRIPYRGGSWVALYLGHVRIYPILYKRINGPLENAQRCKLDFAIDAYRLKASDLVLDVGGDWGSFTEHAGRRGNMVD